MVCVVRNERGKDEEGEKNEKGQTGAVHAGAQTEVTLISQGIIYYTLKIYQVASESWLLSQKVQIWLLAFLLKGPMFNRSDLYYTLYHLHSHLDRCVSG